MIKLENDKSKLLFCDNHYGRELTSILRAYGTGYDFCRFYKSDNGNIGIFNSSMVIDSENIEDTEEIKMFIKMNVPTEIKMPIKLAEKVDVYGYSKTERTLFQFIEHDYPEKIEVEESPNLKEVFSILREGFDIDNKYEMWLTDTSHRVRHNETKLYKYENTTATMYFEVNGEAFFGQIATASKDRGKGNARKLLYYLADKMNVEGKTATLFALPHRKSFYKEIGFKEIEKDILFVKE